MTSANSGVTRFHPDLHIINLLDSPQESMSNGAGTILEGITGSSGARALLGNGDSIGVDRIAMKASTAFGLHSHPGSHLLVVTEGQGFISIDGVNYELHRADSIYVPAAYAHGVEAGTSGLVFIAFGYPHVAISSDRRMTLVNSELVIQPN
jgi:quercetin dioxygenase-like cupin family protein